MHWTSLSEFIRMGGYGFYIWGSYGVTFLLLGGEVVMLLKRRRDLARTAPQPKPESRNARLQAVVVSDKI